MNLEEYLKLDGTALIDLVQRGEVTPRELYRAACERIDAVNPGLNAVVRGMEEQAEAQLERLEALATRRGRSRYRDDDGAPLALAGLPLLLKDNVPVEGTEACYGSQLFTGRMGTSSDPAIECLREAGATFAGRTNMPEFGLLPMTEPALYGPARNPWNPEFSTGGSSGGSAAAVAAGIVPIAHGNDGGGSIRIPASCCGLVGLKPSRGRVRTAFPGFDRGLAVEHVLTRTVRDSALVLDLTCHHGSRDYWKLPAPSKRYAEVIRDEPRTLRIGFVSNDFTGAPVHPDCEEAVGAIATAMQEYGHHADPAGPEINGNDFNDSFELQWCLGSGSVVKRIRESILSSQEGPAIVRTLVRSPALFRAFLSVYRRDGRPLLEFFTRRLASIDARHHPSDMRRADQVFAASEQALHAFFEDHDLLLTPTLAVPPPRIGSFDPKWPIPRSEAYLFRLAAFTTIANTSGYPAISVPAIVNGDRLPVGVQFLAPLGREDLLLQVAAQLERRRGWSDPPY